MLYTNDRSFWQGAVCIVIALLSWSACHAQPAAEVKPSSIPSYTIAKPLTTIGCRERSSPGLHVVLHLGIDGYCGLLRLDPDTSSLSPEPRYNFNEHARQYLYSTLGPQALGVGLASAIASTAFHNVSGLSPASGDYRSRMTASLANNIVSRSIEFGTSAFLQQEQWPTASGQVGFRKRAAYALYRTFVVPGRDGDELAFPRLAAAAGTAWITHRWHPWQEAAPNAWTQAGWILARYALKSYWTEFKPEIIRVTRKVIRHRDGLPVVQSPPTDATRVSDGEDIIEETRH